MIIAVIKFLHLFCALTLFALMLFNFVALVTKKTALSCKTDYAALTVILLLFITASFLVVPKGYTFATPWINAAFTFLTVISLQLGLAIYFKKFRDRFSRRRPHGTSYRIITINYAIILLILIAIIHDAVVKHTIWQSLHVIPYDIFKISHIISGAVVFGSAFLIPLYWLIEKTPTDIFCQKTLKLALLITLPFLLLQLITGFTIISIKHYSMQLPWVWGTFAGFMVLFFSWLSALYFLAQKHKHAWCVTITLSFITLLVMLFLMANR